MAEEEGTETIRDKNRRIREEAAAKRRAKREGEKVAARRPTLGQLEASEIMDDAFARTTHAVTGWVRRHFTFVQWAIVAIVVGGLGWQVYVYQRDKVMGRTTEVLVGAVSQELSRVGDAPSEDDLLGISDTRPVHKTNDERLVAAEAAYKKVNEGETVRALSRMGLAGVLFDRGKYKEALAEYRSVKDGPLAELDSDVRARAMEGIGLSQEAAGDLEGAKKAFHELANQDSAPLAALGLYHQGRIEKQQGATDKAKAHLLAALKKVEDSKLRQTYVEEMARELLRSIDPSAVPLSADMKKQLEQLEKLQKTAEQAKKAAEGALPKELNPDALKKLVDELEIPKPTPSAAPSSNAP